MKILILMLLPIWVICQEEYEIKSLMNQPSGLHLNDELLIGNISKEVNKNNFTNNHSIPANAKLTTYKDLLINSRNQDITDEEVTEDTIKTENQASQKRIEDFKKELQSIGTQAEQSNLVDASRDYTPYEETEKYRKSGVFDELGYIKGADNDARYNERLKWYGGLDSGFIMNIIGSFIETILLLPTLITDFLGQ